jgi:hypothetical protein
MDKLAIDVVGSRAATLSESALHRRADMQSNKDLR